MINREALKSLLYAEGWLKAVFLTFIIFLFLGGYGLVYWTGGTRLAYLHLLYIPITIAGFLFSLQGGIIAGVFAGVLMGPLMPADVALEINQPFWSWVLRLLIFSLVGGLSGLGSWFFRQYLEEVAQRNYRDPLTNLPNFLGLRKKFEDMTEEGQVSLFVCVIEIYHLREIDRALGTEETSQIIRQVGERIYKVFSEDAVVGHMHSKRFALLLKKESISGDLLDRLDALSQETFMVQKVPVFVELRFGFSHFPDDDLTFSSLARKARQALDRAELEGISHASYHTSMKDPSEKNIKTLHELNLAIHQKSLELFYQPKVDLISGKPTGVEALVRWNHPLLGPVSPVEFIPLLEETMLINNFTHWLIETTIQQLKAWEKQGINLRMAVNFSMRNFQDSHLIDTLKRLVDLNGIQPHLYEIEVTESAIAPNLKRVADVLSHLRAVGFKIAIDDFGTGQSSQQYLFELPVDVIKIDKIFVDHILENEGASAITRSAILLGHELKLEVVAEGIEILDQYNLLKEWGCDTGQGYLMSKPLPVDQVTPWLKERLK